MKEKTYLQCLFVFVFSPWALHTSDILLNQLQVIGTHNSFHKRPDPSMMALVRPFLPGEAESWDYTHEPLDVQLERGIRSLELDVFAFVSGFRVMHVPIFDEESNCPDFRECLRTVMAWSEQHPNHLAISMIIDFKINETIFTNEPLLPFDISMLEAFEQTILEIIPQSRLLTPDDVRRNFPTLREAVQTQGWPSIKDTVGKFYFVLHNQSELRAAYTKDRPSLQGRLMFVNSSPDREDAAFSVLDNPYDKRIAEYIDKGMIIRTRADAGLREGNRGDISRKEQALRSGAQIICTDFPNGRAHPTTGYVVTVDTRFSARCNPILMPQDCQQVLATGFLENRWQ